MIAWMREPGRKAHVTTNSEPIMLHREGTVASNERIGTRWRTLCPVDVRHFFPVTVTGAPSGRWPEAEFLSPWNGSLVIDPDVICLSCFARLWRDVSGSNEPERVIIRALREGRRPKLV